MKCFLKDSKFLIYFTILLFVISCIFRFCLYSINKLIYIYPDEQIYLQIARSIAYNQNIAINNIDINFKNILYSILLSPIMLINNTGIQMVLIGVLNSVLASSILFPIYLFLKNIDIPNRIKVIISITVILLPDLCLSSTFMSENIFYVVSLWLMLYVWKFIKEEDIKRKKILCVFCSIFCFFCYLSKMASLYFLVAFILMLIFDLIIDKKSIKTLIINIAIFIGTFFILKITVDILFFRQQNGNIYSDSIQDIVKNIYTIINNPYNLLNLAYVFIINISMVLLAFLYLPIIVPLYNFTNYPKSKKVFLFFVFSSLLIALFVISVLISYKENYGSIGIRIHLRYFSSLFIPLFFVTIENLYCNKKEYKVEYRKIIIITVLTVFCIFIVPSFIDNVSVDGVLITYFTDFISNKVIYRNGSHNLTFNLGIIVLKLIIIIFVFVLSDIFCIKKSKLSLKILLFTVIILNIINSGMTYQRFKKERNINKEAITEVITLNSFISKIEGNLITLLSEKSIYTKRLFDTYLSMPHYDVAIERLPGTGEKEYIDIFYTQLMSNYPFKPYNINKIDYILTDKKELLNPDQNDLIKLQGVENFYLYKSKEPQKLYYDLDDIYIFPKNVGDIKEVKAQDGVLYTEHTYNWEYYLSNRTGGILVYGPYAPIDKGIYNFYFYYDYSGIDENVIGIADVYLTDTNKILGEIKMTPEMNIVKLENIIIDEDCKRLETRVKSEAKGIKFYKVVVEKVE